MLMTISFEVMLQPHKKVFYKIHSTPYWVTKHKYFIHKKSFFFYIVQQLLVAQILRKEYVWSHILYLLTSYHCEYVGGTPFIYKQRKPNKLQELKM